MTMVIERIIKTENAESTAFIKKQEKRLEQLRHIERRKQEGKRIPIKQIIAELQEAGILDESENLAFPYGDKE